MAYHDLDGHVSNSMRKVFSESRLRYHHQYVLGNRDEPTPAMIQGQYLHALMDETADRDWAVMPDVDGRTKEGKQIRAEFAIESEGKSIIPHKDAETAKRMADSIRSHRLIAEVLRTGGEVEKEWRWTDKIPKKCKPDLRVGRVLFDWKTTTDASPQGFARALANFEYHQQAPWYMDGLESNGVHVDRFAFVAVCKSEPYEVGVYLLSDRAIELGRQRNSEQTDQIAACMESGDWTEPQNVSAVDIDLPAWAYRQESL